MLFIISKEQHILLLRVIILSRGIKRAEKWSNFITIVLKVINGINFIAFSYGFQKSVIIEIKTK